MPYQGARTSRPHHFILIPPLLVSKKDLSDDLIAWINDRLDSGLPLFSGSLPIYIEDFVGSNLVLSRDEFNVTGPVEARAVEEVFVKLAPILNEHVRGQIIRTTGEHPFYVENKGWVNAQEVNSGDRLLSHDGQWLEVSEIEVTDEWETVYNLRIAEYHTYFVGCDEWGWSAWAHNSCDPRADKSTKSQGEHYRARAQYWWSELPKVKRYGATVAVSEVDGIEVVSLYANIGKGQFQFSQKEVNDFINKVAFAGGKATHTYGKIHAEEALHMKYPQIQAIGISHPDGPCQNCMNYFLIRGYFNLYWPD
ncbi:MAG: polymorphic toxin-type HINT domain-containing protein [Zavarzinella sp.]